MYEIFLIHFDNWPVPDSEYFAANTALMARLHTTRPRNPVRAEISQRGGWDECREYCSVADPDPETGAFLTPWKRYRSLLDFNRPWIKCSARAESIEWFIEDKAFLRCMIWLLAHFLATPSPQQVVSLVSLVFLCVAGRGVGGGAGEKPNHRTTRQPGPLDNSILSVPGYINSNVTIVRSHHTPIAFCNIDTAAEFLDVIETKVYRVFLLAIHSHLY